ncbi:MAG: hypothetical protein KH237_06715, partial [Clostridium sp.]|nr:hypothetical protein [Clostridium sp.]
FSFLEFSGLHYCLFVKVLCAAFSAATVDILSHVVWTVKHFFQKLFLQLFRYIHRIAANGEGGI